MAAQPHLKKTAQTLNKPSNGSYYRNIGITGKGIFVCEQIGFLKVFQQITINHFYLYWKTTCIRSN